MADDRMYLIHKKSRKAVHIATLRSYCWSSKYDELNDFFEMFDFEVDENKSSNLFELGYVDAEIDLNWSNDKNG